MALNVHRLRAGDDTAAAARLLIRFFREEGFDTPDDLITARIAEMAAIDPVAVIVKGDLSLDGQPDEWEAFERCYRPPFGYRLHVVRGKHDAYRGQDRYAGDEWIELLKDTAQELSARLG